MRGARGERGRDRSEKEVKEEGQGMKEEGREL